MSLSVSCSKYFVGSTYLNPSCEVVYGIAYGGELRRRWGGVPRGHGSQPET